MAAAAEPSAEEIKRLRRCINDLVSVLALPAMWTGGGPADVVRTLLDVLLGMLSLDLVYVRLNQTVDDAPIAMARTAPTLPAGPGEIGGLLDDAFGPDPRAWPAQARQPLGGAAMALVVQRLGVHGELGVMVAGARRPSFPEQTEMLVLGVAANQAAIGLNEGRLMHELRRIAGELDRRVAQRTEELAVANQELRREIAERRLMEERLDQLRSALAQAASTTGFGVMAASIAHEVNQPLAAIVTNADTCRRILAAQPPDIARAQETIGRTIRDAHRASDVIDRVRALFGKTAMPSEPLNLSEAARDVVALSSDELKRNRIVLQAEFADELPPVIGDRVQLQQVILNLLRNASDAMRLVDDRPRVLSIRTELDDAGQVRLTVRDVGVGFEPQSANRLFDAFYSTKNDGMGIGLSVSRTIIESHDGRLWATLNDGPGATFSFSLPRRPDGVRAAPE